MNPMQPTRQLFTIARERLEADWRDADEERRLAPEATAQTTPGRRAGATGAAGRIGARGRFGRLPGA